MPQDLTDDKSTLVQVMACGAVRQQAITWANIDRDLCRQMLSLGLNELNASIYLGHLSMQLMVATLNHHLIR